MKAILSLLGVPKTARLMHTKVERREGQFFVYNMGILMNKVNEMTNGACFGELALISNNENEPRAATVLCEEDTEFAVLDRQSFQVQYRLTRGDSGRYKAKGAVLVD